MTSCKDRLCAERFSAGRAAVNTHAGKSFYAVFGAGRFCCNDIYAGEVMTESITDNFRFGMTAAVSLTFFDIPSRLGAGCRNALVELQIVTELGNNLIVASAAARASVPLNAGFGALRGNIAGGIVFIVVTESGNNGFLFRIGAAAVRTGLDLYAVFGAGRLLYHLEIGAYIVSLCRTYDNGEITACIFIVLINMLAAVCIDHAVAANIFYGGDNLHFVGRRRIICVLGRGRMSRRCCHIKLFDVRTDGAVLTCFGAALALAYPIGVAACCAGGVYGNAFALDVSECRNVRFIKLGAAVYTFGVLVADLNAGRFNIRFPVGLNMRSRTDINGVPVLVIGALTVFTCNIKNSEFFAACRLPCIGNIFASVIFAVFIFCVIGAFYNINGFDLGDFFFLYKLTADLAVVYACAVLLLPAGCAAGSFGDDLPFVGFKMLAGRFNYPSVFFHFGLCVLIGIELAAGTAFIVLLAAVGKACDRHGVVFCELMTERGNAFILTAVTCFAVVITNAIGSLNSRVYTVGCLYYLGLAVCKVVSERLYGIGSVRFAVRDALIHGIAVLCAGGLYNLVDLKIAYIFGTEDIAAAAVFTIRTVDLYGIVFAHKPICVSLRIPIGNNMVFLDAVG